MMAFSLLEGHHVKKGPHAQQAGLLKSILLSWEELAKMQAQDVPFLCDPLIPMGGVILLHGKWSTGKSPLTWHLASCVGRGEPFFGMPCKKGRVLYLEVDTPLLLVKDRTDKLPPAENVWFAFLPPHILGMSQREQAEEFGGLSSIHPDLVIVNTLRKVHPWKDTDSEVPNLVYSAFQCAFPGAAILFVHHDKKDSQDPKAKYNASEAFSGSQHWADDAQVTLHLCRHQGKNILRLENPKNQTAKTIEPLIIQLHENGSEVSLYGEGRTAVVRKWESLEGLSKREIDLGIAGELGIGERAAREVRRKFGSLEEGPQPASSDGNY